MSRSRAIDYDDKRRGLINGAVVLFAEQGYERTSMAQIAASCGVSKALLYHYYDSKEALLFDIVKLHLDDLTLAVEESINPKAPPKQQLRELINATLISYQGSNAEHKIQIYELGALPAERQEELKKIERNLVEQFSNILCKVLPDLQTKEALCKPLTMSLFGILNWHYLWFRDDGPMSREDYVDFVTTLIINGGKAALK